MFNVTLFVLVRQKLLTHAIQAHVERLLNAVNKMVLDHVNVLLNTLEIPMKDVVRSVFSILIVHRIRLVSRISAEILVPELVDRMQIAMC